MENWKLASVLLIIVVNEMQKCEEINPTNVLTP